VSARAARGTDRDEAPLVDAVQRAGMAVEVPCWDDPDVAWDGFDLAVLRSPWDYVSRHGEFLAWLEATERAVRVCNPSPVVRWSTDKRYLADLARRGLPVVPTDFIEPGDAFTLGGADLVVKPVVSAGSKDTARHSDASQAEAHASALLAQGRAVMVQPYLRGIDADGETGLVYFDGAFSHGFRKGPILELDAPATDQLFAPEVISAREPTPAQRAVADAALAASPPDLLYARVDLVPGPDGEPVVIELELAEPSYFVEVDPPAADRFAAAVRRRVGRR